MKIIDLTHQLAPDIPSWDNNVDLELATVTDYNPDLFRTNRLCAGLSLGTHMDAPAHIVPGDRAIEQLTLEELVAPCIVIDVSSKATEEYLVPPSVIEAFEQKHEAIPARSLIIFYTGWSKRWNDAAQYHNGHAFPGVEKATAELLIKRDIVGIGIDTFSCDTGKNGFPVHRVILGADKYLVENVANADMLPPTGAKVFVMPTKIKGATEAPVRLIALV